MMPVRVLHIISGIDRGGAEKHLRFLLNNIDRKRFLPSLVYLKGKGEMEDDFRSLGVEVANIGLKSNLDIPGFLRLKRLIRRGKFDIVHTHLFHADVYGVLAAHIAGVPVIISSKHNDDRFWVRRIYFPIVRLISRLCTKTIAISDSVRDYFINAGLCQPSRIRTIRYGFELKKKTVSHKDTLHRKLGFKKQDFILGTIGRLTAQKGTEYLIKAFRNIVDLHPHCRLVIVGRGELEVGLKNLSVSLGLEKRVFFAGFHEDIGPWMDLFDVFIFPSLWEGFGMVLLEAMEYHKPVIASSVSAIPEIVVHQKTGLLVKPQDPVALGKACVRMIEYGKFRKSAGEAGFLRLRKEFGVQRMMDEIQDLYEECLDRS
jgi:glycosyltransferase involved in cell wall biosynthesis